jgi:hypothetical protein
LKKDLKIMEGGRHLEMTLCKYCEIREAKENSDFCNEDCILADKLLKLRAFKDKYVEAAGRRE